jgi:hypothetical protein
VAKKLLARCRAKRDFTKTEEPSGSKAVKASKRLRFVTQKHAGLTPSLRLPRGPVIMTVWICVDTRYRFGHLPRIVRSPVESSRAFIGGGDEHDTHMAWCAPCFRRRASDGVSTDLARPIKWWKAASPPATQ